ncbi:DUF692 domain-containing protein [Nonomuraea typhae]|uniref:DUF692 domain-containing protein n=1 Tax=Nonomuraea typhae TaxID=2603600 RepID=UPI0012F7810A|nr:DUF692 domain-containing protein [Nonomuraea typhae]
MDLGFGLTYSMGLYEQVMDNRDDIDWLEIITDQFIGRPQSLDLLAHLGEHFPLIPHGVGMSIGSDGPLDPAYVDEVARVADAVDAPWASDHLCFTREGDLDLGTFTPVWRTRDKARQVAAKVRQVQERINRPFLLENIVYHLDLTAELTEAELITEILEHCDGGLLLDLNNVAVNARNLGFDPYAFLDAIPLERVVQVHLAGNVVRDELGGVVLDSHDAPVGEEVFELLTYLASRQPIRAVAIERDDNMPADFAEFKTDLDRARRAVA